MCEGIFGTIGALVMDKNYQDEEVDLPIDTLILDLTRNNGEVDDNDLAVEAS